MDLESAIIFLIMLLIVAIPIAIVTSKKRKKDKQLLQALFNKAQKGHFKITEYDKWGHTAIGIDMMAHRIFFVRKGAENDVFREVDLADVSKCRFINTNRVVNSKEVTQTVIEKLELAFTSNDPKEAETILEFYNVKSDSLALRGEIQLAGKWSALANSGIAALPSKK